MSTCLAREAFVTERYPPMPPPPLAAGMRALGWIFERAERLPRWAQPAVPMGMAFGAYSLLRIFFMLPRMVGDSRMALIALTCRASIAMVARSVPRMELPGCCASACLPAALHEVTLQRTARELGIRR